MPSHVSQMPSASSDQNPRKEDLDKRLAILFWALLFILSGSIWLFPEGRVPDGTWLIGIGLILLSLNAVRMLNRVPVRVLPSVLGALALATGLAEYGGLQLPVFSLTLIAIGASIILELLAARRT